MGLEGLCSSKRIEWADLSQPKEYKGGGLIEILSMSRWKIVLMVIGALAVGGVGVAWYVMNYAELDIYVPLFVDNCGQCHGDELQGSAGELALVGVDLKGGDSVAALQQSIKSLHPEFGTPAFASVLSDVEIKGLAIYIAERRLGQRFTKFKFDREVDVPTSTQHSAAHKFSIETVIDGLDPLVFSIEPLADGSMLLTEKERGLTIISADGVQSEPILGTPRTGESIDVMGIQWGLGWLLDVAVHPDYQNNGWIYLHYTDLCGEHCDDSLPRSMNRLDRGRIVDGEWVDAQTIWQSPREFYEVTPDTAAGGRIAFDDAGHVFISVGIKSTDGMDDASAQDLSVPWGKIHRVNDDGTIPLDNPFAIGASSQAGDEDFTRQSIWTYGHRSPQGLEWHPQRERVWNAEMGPRGGDEINELLPGRNYGWPYFSLGLEYAGTHVERHKLKSLEFDVSETEQTLVDITPSPAISSFAFYSGDQFPNWQGNVLLGSLKGGSLFRIAFDGNRLLEKETLIKDLARIRDVEIGYDGLVYLLLETKDGSSIVRLTPQDGESAAAS